MCLVVYLARGKPAQGSEAPWLLVSGFKLKQPWKAEEKCKYIKQVLTS